MSQTVEFAYAVGDRVRVHDCVRSVFAGQKGVIIEARQTAEHHLFKVVFSNGADELLRSYHLEPAVSEPEAPASAPTFPRVLWQGGIPNSRGERRVVQISTDDCVPEECESYDQMKKAHWKIATWDTWVRGALIALAAGKSWFNGSDQDT